MKSLLTACLLFAVYISSAQQIRQFLNAKNEPADEITACYFSITEKKDTLWQRTIYYNALGTPKLIGSYLDSACKRPHGDFTTYYPSGNLESVGPYERGKKHGLWLVYYDNGIPKDSALFRRGNPFGMQLHWHANGTLSDSAVWNADGSGIQISWFNNGQPSAGGRFAARKKFSGKWQFFHKNGQRSAVEVYDSTGILLSREYFDETGKILSDTASKDAKAAFPGGPSGWRSFIARNVQFPRQYQDMTRYYDHSRIYKSRDGDIRVTDKDGNLVASFADKDMWASPNRISKWQRLLLENMFPGTGQNNSTTNEQVTVVVAAIIDEEGNVRDLQIDSPSLPEFNMAALEVMRRSPKWNPAVSHNRKVRYGIRQPITFVYPASN